MDCEIRKLLLDTVHFKGKSLVHWNVVESKTDFGFMSSIYEAQLKTADDQMEHCYDLIIKVMKGSEEFRLMSLSYLQFQNEIYLYEKILPFFKSYVIDKAIDFDLSRWLAKTYLSISQQKDDMSTTETILVQENVQKNDFYVEQSLYLTEEQLHIMTECLAQFHAVSLALKIERQQEFLNVVNGIQPLCFEQPKPSLYDVLHDISTTRLFGCVFAQEEQSDQFMMDMNQLKEIVGCKPVKLLDRFRRIDDFAVIGHGDFHRNNVLFKTVDNCVVDMKMIDFQQIRYGSPCLDLSFFMYLNITAELREALWDKILRNYHQQLLKHTAAMLNIPTDSAVLSRYCYENFIRHCERFFLYGALISASFTPWLLTTRLETEKISELFQQNMFDDKYKQFALVVGGEAANSRIIGNMMHASTKGYMKILYE